MDEHPEPGEPTQEEVKAWYPLALDFYKQEIEIISQRNSAFLVVQSILVAALVTLLVNAGNFPYALSFIVWAITAGGALFCLSHHKAGRSGAQAAFYWRQYLVFLEGKITQNSPLKEFVSYTETKHKHLAADDIRCLATDVGDFLGKPNCDRCLVTRLPLPHAWITSTFIFSLGWTFLAIYLTVRLFLPSRDPIVLSLLAY